MSSESWCLLKCTFISSSLKGSNERVEIKILASTSKLSHNYQGLAMSFVTVPVSILKHLYAPCAHLKTHCLCWPKNMTPLLLRNLVHILKGNRINFTSRKRNWKSRLWPKTPHETEAWHLPLGPGTLKWWITVSKPHPCDHVSTHLWWGSVLCWQKPCQWLCP